MLVSWPWWCSSTPIQRWPTEDPTSSWSSTHDDEVIFSTILPICREVGKLQRHGRENKQPPEIHGRVLQVFACFNLLPLFILLCPRGNAWLSVANCFAFIVTVSIGWCSCEVCKSSKRHTYTKPNRTSHCKRLELSPSNFRGNFSRPQHLK